MVQYLKYKSCLIPVPVPLDWFKLELGQICLNIQHEKFQETKRETLQQGFTANRQSWDITPKNCFAPATVVKGMF